MLTNKKQNENDIALLLLYHDYIKWTFAKHIKEINKSRRKARIRQKRMKGEKTQHEVSQSIMVWNFRHLFVRKWGGKGLKYEKMAKMLNNLLRKV